MFVFYFQTPVNQSFAVAEKEVSHGILRSGRKQKKKPNQKDRVKKKKINKQTKKVL